MKYIFNLLILLTFLNSCNKDGGHTTCDCFDEKHFAYSFGINIKSYNPGISIKDFISVDSIYKPKFYKIRIFENDSIFYDERFDWYGDGKKDSIVKFSVRSAPYKVTIDIDTINFYHTLSKFELEGISVGNKECSCFNPTKKTYTVDDSLVVDVLNKFYVFNK